MMFPFESLSDERRALGLGVAVVVGLAFGFVQERSGFGRAQKLVGQFYGYDMTVLKVMFTAIVTAMLGTVVLSGLGFLDLRAVEFNYPTFLWPMIVGGLILGVGFIVSGYCPGTSFVATASGKLDGLFTVVGVMVGTLVYAEVEPAMGGFQNSGKLGTFFLYQWLHVPRPLLAVIIAALAVAAFAGASKIERVVRGGDSHSRQPVDTRHGEAARTSGPQHGGPVLVTGSSSGIGADLARAFARGGLAALTELCRLFAEDMVVRGSGGILNVAGLAGVMPGPHMAVYCATKAYVLSFSAALANELRGTGVTVTCLSPGPTETRFGETAGFSALQLFRLSAPMSSITVAEAAIAALARGADLEVPGWRNRLLAASVRLVSTRMAAGIARHMLESPRAAAKKVAVSE